MREMTVIIRGDGTLATDPWDTIRIAADYHAAVMKAGAVMSDKPPLNECFDEVKRLRAALRFYANPKNYQVIAATSDGQSMNVAVIYEDKPGELARIMLGEENG